MAATRSLITWNRGVKGTSRYARSPMAAICAACADALPKKHFKQKSLIILRSCNELLRRLSRAEDTVFCGRVFIFLFQSFPLGDKSSVNLRGEFHTENVTTYDEIAKPATKDSGEDTNMTEGNEYASHTEGQTDEGSRAGSRGAGAERENAPAVPAVVVSTDKKANPQDGVDLDSLYPVFWSLQSYFSAPSKTFDAERFASFKAGLEATLSAFKNINTELENQGAARSAEEARKSNKRKRQPDGGEVGDNFNPKYLTSRDLFDLEVSDTAFRRHVLVQALILLDFMLSLTPKAKARLADLTNKSVLYGFVLNDEDANWALNMRKRIEGYLREGLGGNFYYRMVDTVLSRDKNWARWKAEGCPPIERPPVSVSDYLTARENATRTYASKRLRPSPMGALDLKFLSDSEALANVERLKEKDRFNVPAAQSFMMGIMDDEMDIDMAQTPEDKEAALRSKSSKTWRILRLTAKTKLAAFDKIDDGNNMKVLFESPEAPTETPQPAEGNEGVAQQSEDVPDGAKDTSADTAAENNANVNGTHQEHPAPSEEHASEPAPVGSSAAAVEDDHEEDPAT